MKRQDDSGCRLAVDSVGSGAATDVNITGVGGVPVSSPLPVSGTVTVNQPVVVGLSTSTVYDGTTALTPKFAVITASNNGNNTIVGAVALKKIRVIAWSLMASGTVNAKWQSAAGGTDKTGLYYFVANTGISASFSPVGYFETVAGELLNLNLSAGVAVGGSVVYVEV